ncbi:MAG TPA: PaaI family thioesterase [Solirubrobacteraceae bacterium]|jgi:1,4-dihydroxy-2-naphthoyl-CoA hydrolase|nr:PaaI family thioesterase [Solirubrobacteraceae bacterium]
MSLPDAARINEMLQGFDRLYGLELVEMTGEQVRARVGVRDELRQPFGLVHGGVYSSIAESITSLATGMAVLTDGNVSMGLSNSTSFLRPITEGTVHAHATRLHRGRTTWVWDVRFSDDDDRLCAVTRMTIAVRPLAAPVAGSPAPSA